MHDIFITVIARMPFLAVVISNCYSNTNMLPTTAVKYCLVGQVFVLH